MRGGKARKPRDRANRNRDPKTSLRGPTTAALPTTRGEPLRENKSGGGGRGVYTREVQDLLVQEVVGILGVPERDRTWENVHVNVHPVSEPAGVVIDLWINQVTVATLTLTPEQARVLAGQVQFAADL